MKLPRLRRSASPHGTVVCPRRGRRAGRWRWPSSLVVTRAAGRAHGVAVRRRHAGGRRPARSSWTRRCTCRPARPAPAILLAHGFGGDKTDLATQARDLARARLRRAHLQRPRVRQLRRADPSGRAGVRGRRRVEARRLPRQPRQSCARTHRATRDRGRRLVLRRRAGAAARRLPTTGSTRSRADITWNNLSTRCSRTAAATGPGVFKKLWAGVYLFQAAATGTGDADRSELSGGSRRTSAPPTSTPRTTGTPDAAMRTLLRAASPASVLGRDHARRPC